MLAILNIEENMFFDKNVIKVFDGIAGSAKSSTCAKVLADAGVEFLRCTSTNKLKKDAARRFGGNNATIASGLFSNEDGVFYNAEKDIKYSTVLIDEALQADRRVFKWCENHVGEVNIIICTDSRQMLPPAGDGLLTIFKEFVSRPDVSYINLNNTLRPVDDYTKAIYNDCYNYADIENNFLYSRYKNRIKTVSITDIEYNYNDAYIVHTNEIEKYLYTLWDMPNRWDAPLIPKGTISSKDIDDPHKYPIVPQEDIGRLQSYFQIENIGTVTRYQGSEVEPDRTLYYFVERKSLVENREFYTMISRAKSFSSIRLVLIDIPKKFKLITYKGKPIIEKKWGDISGDTVIDLDGTTINKIIEEKGAIDFRDKQTVLDKINSGDHSYYYYGFTVDGERIREVSERTTQTTMGSLIKKEPLLRSDFMEVFYHEYDMIQQKNKDNNAGDNIWTPSCIDSPQRGSSSDYKYGVDLYSAYPHCFKYGAMPDGRVFYTKDIKNEWDAKRDGLIRFYVNYSRYGSPSMVFTGELVDYIKENGITYQEDFQYLGACHKIKTTITGDWLMNKAYKNADTKKKLKDIHYGYMQKPFIEPAFYDDRGQVESYIINDGQNLEICMVCVQSELALQMLKLKMAIYGNIEDGYTLVDCLYFNSEEEDIFLQIDIADAIPNYDFRIFDNTVEATKTSEKPVIYKSYEELKKRSHHKKKVS